MPHLLPPAIAWVIFHRDIYCRENNPKCYSPYRASNWKQRTQKVIANDFMLAWHWHWSSVCCEDGEEFMGRKGSGLWAMGEIMWQSEGFCNLTPDYVVAMSALAVAHTCGVYYVFFPCLAVYCQRREDERFSDIMFNVCFGKDRFLLNLSR